MRLFRTIIVFLLFIILKMKGGVNGIKKEKRQKG